MKKVRRKLNRIGALALAVVLMGTSIDFPVIAAGKCEHHTEHTEECGYQDAIEGSECTHVHGDECYSEEKNCVHSHDGECGYVKAVEGADCNHSHDENCGENGEECTHTEHTSDCGYKEPQEGSECNHECSEESGCIETKENCNHTHDESCGYKAAVEGTPCIFVCDDCASEESGQEDEEENDTCICEEKCTVDAVNEECPVCAAENADLNNCIGEATGEKIITAWSFIDEYECIDLETNTLALPGASAEKVALKSDVISLLPTSIVATVNETEENITLSEWECEDYPETGAYAGTYTFTATLPVGYTLGEEVSELTVNVELGGAGLYDEEPTTGDFAVTGGTNGLDYTYDNEARLLTIKSSTEITIANVNLSTSTTDRIEVADGVSANITLAGVNIDVSSQSNKAAFKIADNSTGNVTITLADGTTNTLKSGMYCAGLQKNGAYISETQGKLTITGTGSLTATGGSYGAGIGGGEIFDGSNIEISGGTVTATGDRGGAGIGGGIGGGSTDNIKISGGTVKADTIGCTPTDGTANATPVYLLELDVDGTSAVTINGKAYPTKHFDENKVYIYLPEGEHTIVKDGGAGTTAYYAKNADNKLETVVIGTAFTITGTDLVYGTDYTYPASTGVLTILSDKDITIKNATPSTSTTDRIEVADGVSAKITLAGVNIDVSLQIDTAAFKIADNSAGNVTITLAAGTTNTLKSGGNCAGLQKNGAYISETQGKLTITGTGSLTATGGDYGAGIGGVEIFDVSNITISGGTVTATGGKRGAGIGGGYRSGSGRGGSGSYITISGGTVTATGGDFGAGIGGGWSGSGSDIKISGGEVTAAGGEDGAGIGGGATGGSGSNIEISGGTVTAQGSDDGAGIGGGNSSSGSYITISGGTVTATGGAEGGAGIGGGISGRGSNITISDGTVTATGGAEGGAGIGGGGGGSTDKIKISGGTVKADTIGCTPTDGTDNVYLLELDVDGTSAVTINGKAYPTKHFDENKVYIYLPVGVHTIVKDGGAGTTAYYAKNADNKLEAVVIGTAFTITGTDLVYGTDYTYPASTGVLTILSDKDITIKNATPSTPTTNRIEVADGVSANITLAGVNIDVSSQSDTAAFKIADNSAGNVTITLADGTTNTLKSGVYCAGLQKNGAYISETQGKLTITSTGSLSAQGGIRGAGIGGGFSGSGSNIEISGGTVTATGGTGGAGIGGGRGGNGYNGRADNIKISGGTVTATGGEDGAGIGGGSSGRGSNIEISGGTVTAEGGAGGAGIGGGSSGSGSNIKISGGKVTATGGEDGAGIGGGFSGSGSNIEISGGKVTATGGEDGAGIGGCSGGSGSDIKISGGTVTATGGAGGAGIGGGNYNGIGIYIEISGGSVKAVAGTVYQNCVPAAIGQGVQYDSNTGVYSNGAEVTPTDGTDNVYLLELTSATSSLKIDGKDYPINHGTDGKVYVYLPEGEHTIVKGGGAGTTARYAKNADNKLEAVATGGGSDDDSGDDETGGSSGSSSGGSSGGSSDDSSAGITEGGITSDKPVTQTPISQAPAENIVAPATPQPGGNIPAAEPDEETDIPEPFIKGDDGKEGWDVIRDEVEDAEVGDTVTVDMNGTTVVPGDVLNDIKGKDITMVFDLGDGITWSVNGLSITSDNVGDIDFEVKVGADANDTIPVEVHNVVTGESYFVNISLAYDGEFGFEAVLSVNLEKENAGLYANLYYYNPQTNEMEFICSDVIAEDGTAELIFTHASEYTIVIDKVAMDAPASSEEGILPEIGVEAEDNSTKENNTEDTSNTTEITSPKEFGTEEKSNTWLLLLLTGILAAAGIAGGVFYSKKKKSE